MHAPTLTLTLALLLALTTAHPTTRNTKTDPMILTFWENGCHVPGTSNQETYLFTSDPNDAYAKPGDCVPVPYYNWQSVELHQDSKQSYKVELFSGEGCHNDIETVTADSCYTAPEGHIILSARATLK